MEAVTAMHPTRAFLRSVEPLRMPTMGTENVAPLLYELVRLARPRRVLELGMGYTTPFIALALDQLVGEARSERDELAAKTAPYLDGSRTLDAGWLARPPALAAPAFYEDPYVPTFVAADHLRGAGSSAPRVRQALQDLDLAGRVTILQAEMDDLPSLLPAGTRPFDFAWVDAWECLAFFETFWDDVAPDGGIVLMHYLLTYPEGAAVLDSIRALQRTCPAGMEIVSLLEPHKLSQNSLTLIRKTTAYTDPVYASGREIDCGGIATRQARRFLERYRGRETREPGTGGVSGAGHVDR